MIICVLVIGTFASALRNNWTDGELATAFPVTNKIVICIAKNKKPEKSFTQPKVIPPAFLSLYDLSN